MILTINGAERTFAGEALTLAALVQQIQLEGKRIAVELNGRVVSRTCFAETLLQSGDKLEIIGAVGGG